MACCASRYAAHYQRIERYANGNSPPPIQRNAGQSHNEAQSETWSEAHDNGAIRKLGNK